MEKIHSRNLKMASQARTTGPITTKHKEFVGLQIYKIWTFNCAKGSVLSYIFYTKIGYTGHIFWDRPVSQQSRWGVFFLLKYTWIPWILHKQK